MTWGRFQYLCRALAAGQSSDTASGADFYGPPPPSGSLSAQLLAALQALPEGERVSMAGLYAQLPLTRALALPPRLQHIIGYLGLLALVYYGLAMIYYLRVLPSFAQAFEHFGGELPGLLSGVQYYWYLPLLLVALLLFAAVVAGLQLQWLYDFSADRRRKNTFLLPQSLTQHHAAIAVLLRFPLAGNAPAEGTYVQGLTTHLHNLQATGLPLQPELDALLRVEGNKLYRQSSRYLQALVALVGVALIASIFLFLASAYAPIFVLGEVI